MPTLKLDGDARGAVKAVGDLNTEVAKTTKAFDGAAGAAKKLERDAARIVRENEGPQDRYNRKVAELSRLFVAGKLSVQQMDLALARYQGEITRVGATQQSTFGATAVSMMSRYFMAIAGPGAMIAGAITALRNYKAELDNINQSMQGDRSGLGELTQLAITDKNPAQKMAALVAEAKQIYASGATTTLGEAGHLVFTLESASILDPKQRKAVTDMLASGVIPEARQLSSSIAAVRTAFPDMKPEQLVGMGIAAAIPSPSGAAEVVQHTGKSAAALRALGWSPGFGLAATSILSRAYGGASEGGVRLEQFMKQVEHFGFQADPSLKGLDPFATIERIQAATQGDEDKLVRYIGNRMEAKQAFRTLANNLVELRNLTDLSQGSDGSLATGAIDLARNTPELDAARQGIASKNRRTLQSTPSATLRELFQAAIDDRVASRREEGRWEIITQLVDLRLRLLNTFESDKAIEGRLRAGITNKEFVNPDTEDAVRRHLESIDAKTRGGPAPSGRQE